MKKVFIQKLPAFQFHLLQKFSEQVTHAVFTREGGVGDGYYESLNVRFGIGDLEENVIRNRELISKNLGIDPHYFFSADQTHSNIVQIIDEEHLRFHPTDKNLRDRFSGVDGLVTNKKEVFLFMQVADCQAIFFYDPVQQVISIVHAGWKGLVKDISGQAIEIMKKKFDVDPKNILVAISPSLGPCCSFFTHPKKELPTSFHPFIDKCNRVDLWSYSQAQLQAHGILPEHIELARICTQCEGGNKKKESDRGKFFSFRQEKGATGRFGNGIFLKKEL